MTAVVVMGSLLLGCIAALIMPSGWEFFLVLPPFVACIFLGWFIIFQNKAIQFRPFRLFFWPLINVTSPVRQSIARDALFATAAFVAGSCVGLLIMVQNA